MRQVIAYLRVSTDRQGKSGLGLADQRAAIARFAAAEGMDIIAEHVEVETGKGADALDREPECAKRGRSPYNLSTVCDGLCAGALIQREQR